MRLSCVTFCVSLNDLRSLLLVQASPYTHWRNHITPVFWKDGCNPLAWGIFVLCPNIRGWFCGWSVKFVRGRRSLSYSRMIGRIIVVRICWTQIGMLFFAFFQRVWHDCCCLVICLVRLLVVWLVSSVLASCQTLRFIGWCKAWNVLFHMCQMMIRTRFRFPWRRVLASGVEFPCPSSEGDSWSVVWCKICGTEIRVKFVGWTGGTDPCAPFVYASEVIFLISLWSSVWFRTTWPMSSERWDVTHSHVEFSCPNIRGWWLCGWSVKFVRGGSCVRDCKMIGRIIVVQICRTQEGCGVVRFFQLVSHDCCCSVICFARLLVVWVVSSVLVVRHSVS